MNSERMRCDSTMHHQARQETKLELMVLHEYTTPKCFPNTSLTIRLSRPLIRTVASLDRVTPTPHPELSCPWDSMERCMPPHPFQMSRHACQTSPAVHGTPWKLPRCHHTLSKGLHGGCQTSPLAIHGTPWKLPRFHHTLSMGLHGCCQTFPLAIHGTPWKLPRFHASRGTPRVRPDPVVTSTEHFPYNKCPKADQNCAGLMQAERDM